MNCLNESGNTFVGKILGDLGLFGREKLGSMSKNTDLHIIVEEICKRLSIPFPCNHFKNELRERNISPDLFIGVFLRSIHPYLILGKVLKV